MTPAQTAPTAPYLIILLLIITEGWWRRRRRRRSPAPGKLFHVNELFHLNLFFRELVD